MRDISVRLLFNPTASIVEEGRLGPDVHFTDSYYKTKKPTPGELLDFQFNYIGHILEGKSLRDREELKNTLMVLQSNEFQISCYLDLDQ